MGELTRILLVEDHVLLRESIAQLLSEQLDFKVVGKVDTIDDGMKVLKETPVDVVLLDISLREQPSAFLRLARSAGFTGKVLVVTAGLSRTEAARLLSERCSGIFLKHEPLPRLIDKIRSLKRETGSLEPAIGKAELEGFADDHARRLTLTSRERQVLRAVCAGGSNKEIAHQLGISEPLVKMVVSQLFKRTGVRSRSQLARVALETYWRELDEDFTET